MSTKKIIFLLLLLVFLSFTTGCLGALFNNKPIIGSTPETDAKVGIEYTYEIVATDPDGDTLNYALVEKPTGMTINGTTGAVSWIPAGNQGTESYTVTIEVSDGKISVFQTFTITVEEALLSSIVVVPSEIRVPIGDSETIESITAHYDNETEADIELDSDDVSYSSDDEEEEIVTVSELGVVTGVGTGTAVITVTYTEGVIVKSAAINVTVSNLSSIIVLPEFMIIYEGSSQSITSIKAYYEGSTTPADIALSEASYAVDSPDTPDIITVNASGVVTGVSASENWQTITVSYTEGSITKTDTVYVKVEEAPLISIEVTPSTMEIDLSVDVTEEITSIIANYSDGTEVSIELSDATYESDTTAVATVSDTGIVTGQSAGTATITVTYTETGITKTDTVAVTVTE